MNWLIVAGCAIFAVAAVIALIGLQLPKEHVSSQTRHFKTPVGAVWDVVSDVVGAAAWRSDLASIEPVDLNRWREVSKKGRAVLYERVEVQAPLRLVIRIADLSLPYGGYWTFELSEDGKKAAWLTITENGFVNNPILRFLSRYVISQSNSIETYLDSLEKKLA
jgi:polyketide cyclase/dehydrase/lipid transport protein